MRKIIRFLPYILVTVCLLYLDRLIGGHALFIAWWVWLMFRREYSIFLLMVFSVYHDVLWSYPLGLTGIITLLLGHMYNSLNTRFALPKSVLVVFIFIFCLILSMIDGGKSITIDQVFIIAVSSGVMGLLLINFSNQKNN